MKYTSADPPLVCMLTTNPCYRAGREVAPVGVLWHSTGANNPMLRRYVQPGPDDPDRARLLELLGVNRNGNDWGHTTREVGVNAFIGRLADGAVTTVQTMPWSFKPWGCGSGKKGSCNNGWIQFEICEDDLADPAYFQAVYREGVELTAYLCRLYGLDPMGTARLNGVTVPVILCHADSCRLGLGSNHGDVYTWFDQYGKTMDDVRRDVAALLKDDTPAPTPGPGEGEDDMPAYEQWKEYMERYRAELRAKEGDPWSEADRAWAIRNGLINGGTGNDGYMWQDFLTREQAAALLHRAAGR